MGSLSFVSRTQGPCRSTKQAGAGRNLGDILSTSLLMQLFCLWGRGCLSPPPLPGWSRLAADIASSPFSSRLSHPTAYQDCLPSSPHHTLCPLSSPPCFTHTGTRAGIRWGLRSPALFQGSGMVGHSWCATAPTVIMRNGENSHYILGQVSPCAGGFAGCPWRRMGLNNSLPAAPPYPHLQGGI